MESSIIVDVGKLVSSLERMIQTNPDKVRKQIGVSVSANYDRAGVSSSLALPPVLYGDVTAMYRCGLNLLINACERSPERGFVELRLFPRSASGGGNDLCLVFECRDTGPSIHQHEECFTKTDVGSLNLENESVLCSKSSPQNLGLYLVSDLIGRIGGDYGYRPGFGHSSSTKMCFQSSNIDSTTEENFFWFSVPIAIPKEDANIILPNSPISSSPMLPHVNTDLSDGIDNLRVRSSSTYSMDLDDMESTTTTNTAATTVTTTSCLPKGNRYSQRETKQEKRKSNSSSVKSRRQQRIKCALIIDDSKVIRKVIDKALSNFGFKVVQAENGMIGLEEMKSTLFDLVLCDFLMPVMDGVDCVQHYREWESSNRSWFKQYIIGISAHADESDSERGLNVGMNKFVSKPLPIKVLRELVSSTQVTDTSKRLDELQDDVNASPYFLDPTPTSSPSSSPPPASRSSNATTTKKTTHYSSSFSSSNTSSPQQQKQHQPSCLIVEDSIAITKALSRCVQRCDWSVSHAKDGREGLLQLQKRNWDVVFVDDQLPLMTGSALVVNFRSWERRLGFIDDDHDHALDKTKRRKQRNVYMCSATCYSNENPPDGFDGAIVKPFTPSRIISILNEIKPK